MGGYGFLILVAIAVNTVVVFSGLRAVLREQRITREAILGMESTVASHLQRLELHGESAAGSLHDIHQIASNVSLEDA